MSDADPNADRDSDGAADRGADGDSDRDAASPAGHAARAGVRVRCTGQSIGTVRRSGLRLRLTD